MPLTYAEARDSILATFRTAWLADPASSFVEVYWWDSNEPEEKPDVWARATVRHATGRNAAIGNKCFIRTGTVTIQIFAQFGDGLSTVDELATVATSAFTIPDAPNGVWYRNVRMNEIGHDGDWFNVNVLADFEYYA